MIVYDRMRTAVEWTKMSNQRTWAWNYYIEKIVLKHLSHSSIIVNIENHDEMK